MSAPIAARCVTASRLRPAAGIPPTRRSAGSLPARRPASLKSCSACLSWAAHARSRAGIPGLAARAHACLGRAQLRAAALELLVDGGARVAGIADRCQQPEED